MKIKAHLSAAFLTIITFLTLLPSCKDSDLWDELPEKISQFITQYFPSSSIESFSESSETYHVRIDNGPGMTFTKDCEWEAINGYGMPLPQVLLFDQLPPAVYNYLEETESLNSVFSMERDRTSYRIVLLDTTLTYDIASGQITGSDAVQGQ